MAALFCYNISVCNHQKSILCFRGKKEKEKEKEKRKKKKEKEKEKETGIEDWKYIHW